MTQSDPSTAPSAVDSARELLALASEVAASCERPDVAESLSAAGERAARPETLVCIAGEFKRGKSALVNALLGRYVCPVDDDLATATVTVLRHAVDPVATVHWRESRQPSIERFPLERLAEFVTELGDPELRRDIELVELGLPHPLLERGIILVDTPGVGGLRAAHGAATLSFLPTADLLLFVCDASAELSAPELSFLRRAKESCPTLIAVLTKIDLYPEWRRIAELNRGHLEAAGIEAPIVPVSSQLRTFAFERSDRALNVESGLPDLLAALQGQGLARAEGIAARRAAREVSRSLSPLREAYVRGLGSLEAPETQAAELADTRARVEQLRTGAQRWRQTLADGFSELAPGVEHGLQGALREIVREFEEQIGDQDPASDWQEMGEALQQRVADAVRSAYDEVWTGARAVAERTAELLPDETLEAESEELRDEESEPRALWLDREITTTSLASQAGQAFTALRGAYGGLLVFGMLANVAGVVVVGPALIGIGALFGGRQFREVRRRAIESRRQEARRFVREFVEEVRFEVLAKLRTLAREMQRELRDLFSERIAELNRTYGEELQRAERAAKQGSQQHEAEARQLRERIGQLDAVLDRARALESTA